MDGGTGHHGYQGLIFSHYSIPKLSTGSSLKPYVRQHNDLAVIDTTRVINPITNNDRQLLASEQAAWKSKKVCTRDSFICLYFVLILILFWFYFILFFCAVDCYEENSTIA